MPGCVDSRLRGRDWSLLGPWDKASLSVAMEDGVREGEQGRRVETAEAMRLLKQVYEKETSIPGIQLPAGRKATHRCLHRCLPFGKRAAHR